MKEHELIAACAQVGAQLVDAFDNVEERELLTIVCGDEHKVYLRII